MPVTKPTLLLCCLLAAVLGTACNEPSTSSPTAPDGTPLVFAGTVGFMGTSAHDVVLVDDSLMSVTLAEVRVLLWDTTRASIDNLVFGFGVGQRDDEGECNLTSNILMTQGQLRIYRLSKNNYCITVFDAGSFPEDALLSYRLQVELTS